MVALLVVSEVRLRVLLGAISGVGLALVTGAPGTGHVQILNV